MDNDPYLELHDVLLRKLTQLEKSPASVDSFRLSLPQLMQLVESCSAVFVYAQQKRWINDARHDLSNPLGAILGFTQLLLDSDQLPAQQRQDVETILVQAERCRTLMTSLASAYADEAREASPSLPRRAVT